MAVVVPPAALTAALGSVGLDLSIGTDRSSPLGRLWQQLEHARAVVDREPLRDQTSG